jgi:2'-5' RNA ligase
VPRPRTETGGSAAARPLRLFFALWPDPPLRAALAATAAALRRSCGGRPPPARNLHLTLAFLGEVAPSRLPELVALAAGIPLRPFTLTLDRTGWWPRQRLVWAGARECPAELEALAGKLAGALRTAGFRSEHRPFVPHVTLLRDAQRAPPQNPLQLPSWKVEGFVLACSGPSAHGVAYRIVGRSSTAGTGHGL